MVGLVVVVAIAIVVALWNFFYLAQLLWEYWYVTIVVAVLVWIALLGFEFGPRPADLPKMARVYKRWIPFTVKRRIHPAVAYWRRRFDH